MKNAIYAVTLVLLAFAAGMGAGRVTKRCPGSPALGPGVVVTPGRVVDLARRTIPQKIAQREVKPIAEFKHTLPDSSPLAEQFQVTLRRGVLSFFVPDSAGLREVQFRMRRAAFDAAVGDSGAVRVVEDRCWVCEPRLDLEAGALVSAGNVLARPYLGGDASVAVLRPWNRLFLRAELEAGDARLMLGARLTL